MGRPFAEPVLEGLLALVPAIEGVASGIANGVAVFVAQALGQFDVQRRLLEQLGQRLERAVLANELFRCLSVGRQAGQHFLRCDLSLACDCVCAQAGFRMRWIVRSHEILNALHSDQSDFGTQAPPCFRHPQAEAFSPAMAIAPVLTMAKAARYRRREYGQRIARRNAKLYRRWTALLLRVA